MLFAGAKDQHLEHPPQGGPKRENSRDSDMVQTWTPWISAGWHQQRRVVAVCPKGIPRRIETLNREFLRASRKVKPRLRITTRPGYGRPRRCPVEDPDFKGK